MSIANRYIYFAPPYVNLDDINAWRTSSTTDADAAPPVEGG